MRRTAMIVAILALSVPSIDSSAADDGGSPTTDAGIVKAHPIPAPNDVGEAVDDVKNAYQAAKEGRWWYFSAIVITILMFVLKFVGIRVGFWAKMGRWRYIVPPVLSIVAAVLAAYQGGVSFDTTIGVFTSSYATSSLQELWEHGILGKPRASAGTNSG